MSNSPTAGDAFARVSAALLSVWPTAASPTTGLTRGEIGRLLDECGSDYKPLVLLLLDIGRSVYPVLQGMTPHSASTWQHARAPLVHQLVSTRYLQADVARWAVDVWGEALKIAPPPEPPRLELPSATVSAPATSGVDAPAPAPARKTTGRSTAASSSGAGATARPTIVAPHQVPASLRQTPSWAGGPMSFGIGQKPKSATLSSLAQSGRLVVGSSVPQGPRFLPAERRAAIILLLLLVIITVGLMNSFSRRPDVTTPIDANVGAISARENDVTALTDGAAVPPAALERVDSTSLPPTVPQAVLDVHDDMVAAPLEVDRATRLLALNGHMRDAGVGGRYRVTQRVRDVSGSISCDAVAGALAAGRESDEVVTHVPGSARFSLVTRGVEGTLDADGLFVSQLRVGTTNNVNWQFQMRGRFGPNGFAGESTTHTDAVLRWGKLQTCVVTADLTGQRLPE